MSCKNEQLRMWKLNKTKIKAYMKGGALLEGYVVDYCDDSFILDKCLVFFNSVISIKPA